MKIIVVSVIAAIFVLISIFPAISSVPSEYCSVPPFLSNTVPPNVLIVLDNSLSMYDWAYSAPYDATRLVSGSTTSKGYYGYFEPSKNYKYTGNEWVQTTDTSSTDPAKPVASGDFLNWATMRRIDIGRKLLIGGKATPRSPNPGSTVALYGETGASSMWNFSKTDSGGRMSPFPAQSYNFAMKDNKLYVTPNFLTAGDPTRVPKSNYNANWSYYGQSTQYRTVDDRTINDDTDYIYITSGAASQLFGYDSLASSLTGSVSSVTVRLRAKKTKDSKHRVTGTILIGTTEYPNENDANLDTDWDTYQFTWDANPKRHAECTAAGYTGTALDTCAAWQNGDLIDTASAYYVKAFGVTNVSDASSSLYSKVTWIEISVSMAAASGGPYVIKVDWKGEDWAYEQGIIPSLGNDARFGLGFYNSTNEGGYVANIVNFDQPTNMITTIHNMTPSTYTPLGETLYEMIRYFRQDEPYYRSQDYTVGAETANDPYYYYYGGSDPRNQYVPCVKSFVLLLTDGESTYDQSVPDITIDEKSLRDYDGDGKDGTFYALNGSDYLDDVALWGRTADARPGACTVDKTTWPDNYPCLPGNQNVMTYSVFMFGKGSSLLKDASKNGGFNDSNNNNRPDCSTIPSECYRETNNDGTLNSSDLPLTYFEGDDGYELEESIKDAITSILKRAASGTAVSVLTTSSRGVGSMLQAYFHPSRQEGNRTVTWTGYVQNLWLDPFDDLREDTVNDFQLKLADDKVLKLYFDTQESETMVGTFTTDASGNSTTAAGELNSCRPSERRKFMDINYLWEGGKKLALTDPSARSIFTSRKSIVGSTETILDSTLLPKQPTFSTSMSATLKAALNADATYTQDNIVRYVRGECLETGVSGDTACASNANSTYRDRRLNVSGGDTNGNVWKLGDVITSTPKVFAEQPLNAYHDVYFDDTYRAYVSADEYQKRVSNISSLGFIGANDGMLHTIRVGYLKDKEEGGLAENVYALFKNFFTSGESTHDKIGEEVWSYIPYNAFPYLKYLADPDYCHIYYNDLTVNLVDVSIASPAGCSEGNPADCTRAQDSWKTILIGGMRFGGACSSGINPAGPPTETIGDGIGDDDGQCESGEACVTTAGFSSFYALDITDPENPVPMWEFTDPDLGYAMTYPAVLRTGEPNLNGHWYMVIGSGSKQLPKEGQDISRTTTGYVYLLDLTTGALVKKIDLGHNAIVGDLLAVDADRDYKSEKIYFGTAYKDTTWKGKLMSIAIPDQDLTASWTPSITALLADNYPFTASPDAALDEYRNIWVFIGSGKYYSTVDQSDKAQQIFVAMKDSSLITYPKTKAGLDNRTNTTTTGEVTGTTEVCMFDTDDNDFAIKTMVISITTPTTAVQASNIGWYLDLDYSSDAPAERVISRPLAIGGLVDFLSYKPNSDVCAAGGDSYLYSLGYTTGIAPSKIAILHPEVTGGATSGNVTVQKRVKLGPGAPPMGEAIVIPPIKDGNQGKLKKKIQVATGVVVEAENETTLSIGNKIIHWLKK
jgi:type IV pilus assembly protein PilY1